MQGTVINLLRRPDRKRRFLEWNDGHGIDFTFVPAIDGTAISTAKLVGDGLLTAGPHHYPTGAIGNALSHRALWQRCARSDQPMLVFEDDACLRHDFRRYAEAALATAGTDWDLFFFGYNTDAAIAVITPEALFGVIVFDDHAKRNPGYFDKFAHAAPDVPPPYVFKTMRAWGTLGYMVTPAGAQRLLNSCFPLSSEDAILLHVEQRTVPPKALDGMINLALQRGLVTAKCCFPPLVTGPNDDSDVTPRS